MRPAAALRPSTVTPRGVPRPRHAAASPLRVPRSTVGGRPHSAAMAAARITGPSSRLSGSSATSTRCDHMQASARHHQHAAGRVRDHGAPSRRAAAWPATTLPAAPDHDQVGAARPLRRRSRQASGPRASSSSDLGALRIATQRGDALARLRLGVGDQLPRRHRLVFGVARDRHDGAQRQGATPRHREGQRLGAGVLRGVLGQQQARRGCVMAVPTHQCPAVSRPGAASSSTATCATHTAPRRGGRAGQVRRQQGQRRQQRRAGEHGDAQQVGDVAAVREGQPAPAGGQPVAANW